MAPIFQPQCDDVWSLHRLWFSDTQVVPQHVIDIVLLQGAVLILVYNI